MVVLRVHLVITFFDILIDTHALSDRYFFNPSIPNHNTKYFLTILYSLKYLQSILYSLSLYRLDLIRDIGLRDMDIIMSKIRDRIRDVISLCLSPVIPDIADRKLLIFSYVNIHFIGYKSRHIPLQYFIII